MRKNKYQCRMERIEKALMGLPLPECIEGAYGKEIPISTMYYSCRELNEKLYWNSRAISADIIFILAAKYQANNSIMCNYWIEHLFNIVVIQNNDYYKYRNSQAERMKRIRKIYFEDAELNNFQRFDYIVTNANYHEQLISDYNNLYCMNNDVSLINPEYNELLFEKFIIIIEYIIKLFAEMSDCDLEEFKNHLKNI